MTQVCTSSDTCHLLYTLLLDYLLFFVSFLTSQPIHTAYILFFSPYLLPLVSFLSPLILSTSILLLLLFLHWRVHDADQANAASLLDQLGSAANALIGDVFEWEFDTMQEVYISNVGLNWEGEDDDPVDIFLDTSEKELFEPEGIISDADYDQVKEAEDPPPSTRAAEECCGGGGRSAESLQRDGSMRKESKEWKRTLACKLYEERMSFKLSCEDRTVVDGAEEMDLLWEAYEVDSTENHAKKLEEEEEEEDEEEETVNLCCLQALKLSTGKMNLGVRRPNLEKISKVFKGIALFRRSGSRRCKKGRDEIEWRTN